MGTRALITKDGKPFIATHWDGYPSSLGADLLSAKTDEEIIKVAEGHTIDSADKSICEKANKKRYEHIARKANNKLKKWGKKKRYTEEEIKKVHEEGKMINFGLMCAGDYPIDSIDNYGDWAEYQYDLKKGIWYFRALRGTYPDSLNDAGQFIKLTKKHLNNEWR